MDFAAFADRADELEAEEADLATVDLVADALADADADLDVVARFLQGRVFPGWDVRKLAVGPSLCHEAIARAAGTNVAADDVEDRLAETGEIGAVAASYDFGGQTGLAAFGGGAEGSGGGAAEIDGGDGAATDAATGGTDLTVREVFEAFERVAAAEGAGSEDVRRDTLFGLFNRASPAEAKYLARLVLGEMRVGVGGGTVRDAVAGAFLGADVTTPVEDRPEDDHTGELVAAVEEALQVTNDFGRVAELARDEGVAGLRDVSLEVGRPVRAMLAQAGTVTDALAEWDGAAVETKYDGARVQLHYDGEETSVYSRNMEDVTDALPELVEHADAHLDVPAIVDGEAVAVDEDGEPLPFQEILRRFRRKYDVERLREEVSVELRAFDCLHADGEDLLDAPLTERYARLSDALAEGVSELLVTTDPGRIEAVEAEALAAGHEGIMLKNPESTYSPGKRGKNWLKRKPDVETLDLVVTGAEWGEGRRANFLGTFLLSARNGDVSGRSPEARETGSRDGYETIGKVATGITDEQLAELTELLEPHVTREEGTDVEIRPEVVFEVGYEEIQESPTYSSGYALRFPRFVEVRTDKDPEDADSLERVERLADAQ